MRFLKISRTVAVGLAMAAASGPAGAEVSSGDFGGQSWRKRKIECSASGSDAHIRLRWRRAFTLVERLVVVSIIALLNSTLLPSLPSPTDVEHL